MERELMQAEAELERFLRHVHRAVGRPAAAAGTGEFMAQPAPAPALHRDIANACQGATNAANNVARQSGPRRSAQATTAAKGDAARWLDNVSKSFLPVLGKYTDHDLNILSGCLYRVEAAVRSTPPSLVNLRRAMAGRLRVPAAEALFEDEGEAFW
jgi:hypothetical protein